MLFSVTWHEPEDWWKLECKPCNTVAWVQDISWDGGKTWETDWSTSDEASNYGSNWTPSKDGATINDRPTVDSTSIGSIVQTLFVYGFRARARAVCMGGLEKGHVYATVYWGFDFNGGFVSVLKPSITY